MSNLRQPNGDDHPEAARKHLDDASVLHANARSDGTAYLAGYVVECCFKTLVLFEQGTQAATPSRWRGAVGHDLGRLAAEVSTVCAVAGAKAARYLAPVIQSVPSAAIAVWDPQMRYHAPSRTGQDAAGWLADARSVYQETVGQMFLDGVLR